MPMMPIVADSLVKPMIAGWISPRSVLFVEKLGCATRSIEPINKLADKATESDCLPDWI